MLTVNEIATKLGVSVKAATGFAHFVSELHAVKRGSAPSNGNKGKPPFTYGWAEGGVDKVVDALLKLPEAPLTVEAPATATVAPAATGSAMETPSDGNSCPNYAPPLETTPSSTEAADVVSVTDLMAAVANDAPQADTAAAQ